MRVIINPLVKLGICFHAAIRAKVGEIIQGQPGNQLGSELHWVEFGRIKENSVPTMGVPGHQNPNKTSHFTNLRSPCPSQRQHQEQQPRAVEKVSVKPHNQFRLRTF